MAVLPFWNVAEGAETFEGQSSLRLEHRPVAAAGLTGENSEEPTDFVHDGGWCPNEFVSWAFCSICFQTYFPSHVCSLNPNFDPSPTRSSSEYCFFWRSRSSNPVKPVLT